MGRDGFGRLVGVAVLFAGLSLIIAPAAGVAMEVRRSTNGAEIQLSGKVEIGDFEKFEAVADTAKNARVSLSSPGGLVDEALLIGGRIRERGLSTTVPDGATCTSACGFIWLAGTGRFVEGNGRVGFHAVYVDGRKPIISGSGNARVGAYMARLGFSDPAIAYATEAGPSEMRWLTPSNASSVGIAVTWNRKAPPGFSNAQIEDTGDPLKLVPLPRPKPIEIIKAREEASRQAGQKASRKMLELVRKAREEADREATGGLDSKAQEKDARVETSTTPNLPFTIYKPDTASDDKVVVASVDSTWNIQLDAYPTKRAAQDALYAARRVSPELFANKPAFTVEVTKGDVTKFRARMSGFTAETARGACRLLTHKGVDCATVSPES